MLPSHQLSFLTVALGLTAVYFMWMDVALYINLQQVEPLPPPPSDSNSSSSSSPTPTTPPPPFSPIYPVRVKMLVDSPTVVYIDDSFAHITVKYTGIASVVSANTVSFCGVLLSVVSMHLMYSDSLRFRQLGVAVMKARDYLDSLDGFMAKENRGGGSESIGRPVHIGWYLDGMCDGIGTTFFFLGISLYLYKTNSFYICRGSSHGGGGGGGTYQRLHMLESGAGVDPTAVHGGKKRRRGPLPVVALFAHHRRHSSSPPAFHSATVGSANGGTPAEVGGGKTLLGRGYLRYFLLSLACGLQVLLSSIFWNTTLLKYRDLYETYDVARTPAQLLEQNRSMKSSTFWMVAYLWRWLNPSMLSQYAMVSVLYDRSHEYFVAVHRLGYLPVVMVAMFGQVYYWIAQSSIVAAGTF